MATTALPNRNLAPGTSRARVFSCLSASLPPCLLRLKRKLFAFEFEAVEVADDARGDALGLEEFARDRLNFLGGDGFEHGDQLLRREVAVEIHVVARQAAHAGTAAFERKKRRALQMILCAAQLFRFNRLVAH